MSLCASFLVFHCIVVMIFVIFLGHFDVAVLHFLSLRLNSCHDLRNLLGTGKCRVCTICKIEMIDVYSFVIVFVIFLGQENVVFLLVEILEMINIVFLYLFLYYIVVMVFVIVLAQENVVFVQFARLR